MFMRILEFIIVFVTGILNIIYLNNAVMACGDGIFMMTPHFRYYSIQTTIYIERQSL